MNVESFMLNIFLAFSQAIFILLIASLFSFTLFTSIKFSVLLKTTSTNLLSKSSPPKLLSPEVPNTSKFIELSISFSKCNIDISNVPPPKSNTSIFLLTF